MSNHQTSRGRLSFVFTFIGIVSSFAIASADDIAPAQTAGTVALISGKAWVRHGDVVLPTPANEDHVQPSVSFTDQTGRELGPNDQIKPGDVVVTGENSFLKIYYRDDSIMDVGPATTFKVSQFVLSPDSRQIAFTLLQGKVRTLVTRALEPTSFYNVATPTASMGVHGTEWVTNSYPQDGQYRTDVTVLEGKVVVSAPKPTYGGPGKATVDQVAVTPGHTFSGVGNGGSVSKFSVFKMTSDQVKELAAMVPNIETQRVGALASKANALAGSPTEGGAAPRTVASASPSSSAAVQGGAPIAAEGAKPVSFTGLANLQNQAQPQFQANVPATGRPATTSVASVSGSQSAAASPVAFQQLTSAPARSVSSAPALASNAQSAAAASNAVQAAVSRPSASTVVVSAASVAQQSRELTQPTHQLLPPPAAIAPPTASLRR